MRFYILSDLHLSAEVDKSKVENCLKKLCSEIRKTTDISETVLFIILGDIIAKGSKLSFETAQDSLSLILNELKEYSVKFEFVPGNHDIEKDDKTLCLFDQFISAYGSSHAYENASTYSAVYDGVNFIFSDSNLSRDHSAPGRLDLSAIRANLKPRLTNVLVCHHAISHGQGDPHDTIEDGAAVLKKLNELNISFLFHGHVHRSDITIPDKGLVEIGFGTLFGDVSWMNAVFHQFSVGYIQEGRITLIQRWVDTNDGHNHFAEEDLYPKPRVFADPNSIGRISYEAVDNYMPRMVSAYESADHSSLDQLLGKAKSITLQEAVIKHKKVLMLCDAGMGKSIELANLANKLSDRFHTCLYSLADYTGQDICDILPTEYRQLSSNRLMLLFDGYDELGSNMREIFKRKLRVFIQNFTAANIVISSRSNFCGNEDSNKSKTFPGFNIFVLEKLSAEDVKSYLTRHDIDATQFWNCALAKRVYDLVFNPFYLVRLAELYAREHNLPAKNDLMDTLIAETFDLDQLKFSCGLEDHYVELFSILERLAFAMQLMHKQRFDDRNEFQELFSFEERELIKKSGLLKRARDGWLFLHNNFREYLAARFLSKLPHDIAVSVFSDEIGNVKPSWVNTLGYLTGFDLEWNLFAWLIEKSPSALVKFESDRLDSELRVEVFKRIFGKYETLHLYFNDDLCDEAELAHFTNSSEILIFLLERIETPQNLASQYMAVNILRHYPLLFGKNTLVRECLVKCCEKYPQTHKSICRLAMLALCQHTLQTPETTRRLMDHLGEVTEDYVRLGLYEYLLETGEHNTYVEYFLAGIQFIDYNANDNDDPRIGNELFELIQGLKSMNTVDSVTCALKWLANEEDLNFFNSDEVVESLINSTIDLYQSGQTDMFSVVVSCYIESAKKWNHQISHAAIRFFLATGRLHEAAIIAAAAFEDEPYRMADLISADHTVIEHLKAAYIDGNLKSHHTFREIVIRFVQNEQQYKEYATLIKDTDGVDLPEFKHPIDYNALKKRSAQEYFDILFDAENRNKLFNNLLEAIDDPEITAKQLLEIDLNVDYNSAIGRLRTALYHYGPNIKVSEFFIHVNLDEFILWSASQYLAKNSTVIPSQYQRDTLTSIIERLLKTRSFENSVMYYPDGLSLRPLVPELLSLIQYLDYPLPEDTLLCLSELPAYIFDKDNDKTKYVYLMDKIPMEKLKARLIQNVDAMRVKNMVLKDHIEFFESQKDSALAEYALGICKEGDTYLRYTAWRYLYYTLGAEYLSDEILPIADGDLLIEINGMCKDIPKDKLKEAMEREYNVTSSMQLQAHLITLGSEIAVKDYVSKVSAEKHPPEGKGINFDGPTAAISTLTDPSFLPWLEKLIVVVFAPDFIDCSWKTLRDSLSKALVNCSAAAYNETIELLIKYRPSADENETNFRFCNYTIEDIEHSRKMAFDAPNTFVETKKLLNDWKVYH